MASIDREGVRKALEIPLQCEIVLALALGKPEETVVIEPVGDSGDIKYWRDSKDVHHVPK